MLSQLCQSMVDLKSALKAEKRITLYSTLRAQLVNNSDNADDFPALSAWSFAPDQMAGTTGRDSCKRGCQLGTVKLFCNCCIANNMSEVQ